MDITAARVYAAAEELFERVRSSRLRFPPTLAFGCGVFGGIGRCARALRTDGPALVVTGSWLTRDHAFRDFLEEQFAGPRPRTLHYAVVDEEPTTALVNRHADLARRVRPDLVVGIGGGSAMDMGKAIAALAVNEGPVEDYLEGLGRERRLEQTPLACIAVPTTAGTGAEMTRNAVVACPERQVKKSLRDDRMIPSAALIDPELTMNAPVAVTAASGMDAVTQLIESCISAKRRPDVSALAHEALRWPREMLPRCVRTPSDHAARAAMSMSASISGICLANAGLAMAHGVAAALGARHGMPHGVACGLLLPHTLRWNRDACREELAAALAAFLGEAEPDGGTVDRGIEVLERLNREMGLPPDLKGLALSTEQRRALARASLGSSMSGNPLPMDEERIDAFLASLT